MSKESSFQNKIKIFSNKLKSNRYFSAVTNSLMTAMPILIVGAIGSLINGMPIQPYQDFLVNTGLKTLTSIPNEITTNILALYVVFLIGYRFAESYDLDGLPAGLLTLMAFLIVTPYTLSETGTMAGLSTKWLGSSGLFTAFIIGLLAAKIYCMFVAKGWTVKMPEGVPPTIAKSFSALVPGFVIAFVALAIRGVFQLTSFENMHQFIFGIIATPLTKLGSNFFTVLLVVIMISVLWLFGIHGVMIAFSVFMPIWLTLDMANLTAYNNGEIGPNILTLSFITTAMGASGSGQTIGLTLSMLRAKSARYKTLGKLAIIPNICGINEPIIFGTPVVMNPVLAIPFILVPVACYVGSYLLTVIGILPHVTGVQSPLGTPILISGFIIGGWRWMLWQVVCIVISCVGYFPFFKGLDKAEYELEMANASSETVTE